MKQHDSHWDQLYDRSCPGWTDEQEAVENLCRLVTKWAQISELADPEDRTLKLHCHPSVHHALIRNVEPDFSSFPEVRVLPPGVKVELVTDPELPKGSWRFEIARGAM
jgi:hypothetical protein